MKLHELIKVGLWAIEHEQEILDKLPPEKQAETILAIAKMRLGIKNLRLFIEGIRPQ